MLPLSSHVTVFLYFGFFFLCNYVLKFAGIVSDDNLIILALLVWLVRLQGRADKLRNDLFKNPEVTATQLMMEGLNARIKQQQSNARKKTTTGK